MPRQQEAQHARNQANTSNLEDGETSAVQQLVKTKWTVVMNTAIKESRKEAEQLHNTDNCPRKDSMGEKMELWTALCALITCGYLPRFKVCK